jgi:GTP cyclohydrolase I
MKFMPQLTTALDIGATGADKGEKNMAKTDCKLGAKVRAHLEKLGLETLIEGGQPDFPEAVRHLQRGVAGFLAHLNLNVEQDPSICDTPRRVGEMMAYELCHGLNYANFPKCTTTPNGVTTSVLRSGMGEFGNESRMVDEHKGRADEMVRVAKIQTISLCEHHFQTITGWTHIAYIPNTKLMGLSKFARVTNFFARRPQVQERMTEQLYAALSLILETEDVGIQQTAVHNCMRARGAMDPTSETTTSKMGGKFRSNPALRQEFLHGIK